MMRKNEGMNQSCVTLERDSTSYHTIVTYSYQTKKPRLLVEMIGSRLGDSTYLSHDTYILLQ